MLESNLNNKIYPNIFKKMDLSNQSSIYYSQTPSRNEQQKYKKIKVLGEGSMGKVYLVECPLENNKLYVMKRINIGHLQTKQKQQALLEAQLHNMVKNQNIIEFKEIYHTTKDKLCIIMQYADGGDLDQMLNDLKEKKKMLTEQDILKYFVQICLAMKQIHDKKIVHRDLKGANIFLAKDGKIKIGDFGISKAMDKTVLASKSFVGTPYYLSPQMVEGKPYSTKADIWALGVILYHMVALKLPFDANSLPVLALKILKGSYPQIPGNQYSKQLKMLISSMLLVDQKKRPSISQILMKPILSKYLPKQFVMTITPKIKAKVQIKTQKIKLATTKSKKQLKQQNLSKQEKQKKRQQQKIKREQERKKMIQDIKAKRMQGKGQIVGDSTGGNNISDVIQLTKNIQINTQAAQIPKKQPIKAFVNKPSSSKNIKQANQQPQQSLKSPRNQDNDKPWKNKNLIKQKKQPQIIIRLPGTRKSVPEIEQKPLPKCNDFEVQIFVRGQNPYKQNNQQQISKQSAQTQHTNQNSKFNQNNSNVISQSYEPSQQVQQQIAESNQYSGNYLQDIMANVQKAQFLVNNLSNPYEQNNIQLYEQSQDFENTGQIPSFKQNHPATKQPSSKQFYNNQSDYQNMKYITNITDGQSLQELRQILQDRLGEENFIKAHQIVKEHFEEQTSLKEGNQMTEQSEAYLFNRKLLREKLNFITQQQFDRNVELLYTISVMQDLDMMKNFNTSSSEQYEDEDEYQNE